MVRYFFGRIRHDITDIRMMITVVLDVGFFREIVPFTGKDAFPAVGLETHTDTTDTGEKVYKAETAVTFRGARDRLL